MRLRKQTTARGLVFEAFGVPIELLTDDSEVEHRLLEVLPPGWRPCPRSDEATSFALRHAGNDGYAVIVGGTTLMDHGTLEVAVGMLDSRVRLHIGAHATDWIFVHAGVVARDGRTLLLPGESFSGKSTLVRALVEQGAVYYSDEYAVLGQDGRVHPYPRPLRIRTATANEDRDVASLGGVVGTQPAEIGMVAVTRYRPGSEWQPRALPRGQGAALMLTNVVAANLRPRESLQVLTRAVGAATVLESDRGEAGPVAAALLRMLGRE
jgi:hypothetical protein